MFQHFAEPSDRFDVPSRVCRHALRSSLPPLPLRSRDTRFQALPLLFISRASPPKARRVRLTFLHFQKLIGSRPWGPRQTTSNIHLGKKILGGYLSVPTDWVVLRPQNLIYTSTLPSRRAKGVNIKSNVQTWPTKHLREFILMPTCHWHLWFELWCLWRVSGHVCTLRAKRAENVQFQVWHGSRCYGT